MNSKRCLAILVQILFLITPSISTAFILFEDNFDTENSGNYIYNWDGFTNWDITDGAVDLINAEHYGFEHLTANGMFVDLDGTSEYAGRMESKTVFDFNPGYTYELSFDLAGSQAFWLEHPNTVTVSLGSIYSQDITLDTYEPFQTFQYIFEVTSPIGAKLIFDHWGADRVGLLLDNVKITSTPLAPSPEQATVDIHPDTLNKKSKGKYITCYIELSSAYNVEDINIETVILSVNGFFIPAELYPTESGDYNDNGIPDLMVKFDRQLVQDACEAGIVEMILTCQTYDEANFEGSDTVFVINKGHENPKGDQGSVIFQILLLN